MIDAKLRASAKRLLEICRGQGLRIATAESCTGGLVAAALTEIAGASDVVECGFVVYSNDAKQTMLGVPVSVLKRHGAVSSETAHAMAEGALKNSQADLAVAITGVAGPGGGSRQKPVGLVYFAGKTRQGCFLHRRKLYGKIGRRRVRERSLMEAFAVLQLLAERTAKGSEF